MSQQLEVKIVSSVASAPPLVSQVTVEPNSFSITQVVGRKWHHNRRRKGVSMVTLLYQCKVM